MYNLKCILWNVISFTYCTELWYWSSYFRECMMRGENECVILPLGISLLLVGLTLLLWIKLVLVWSFSSRLSKVSFTQECWDVVSLLSDTLQSSGWAIQGLSSSVPSLVALGSVPKTNLALFSQFQTSLGRGEPSGWGWQRHSDPEVPLAGAGHTAGTAGTHRSVSNWAARVKMQPA